MGTLRFVGESYILGLLTPLTALCVLPLYPAFLVRMARSAGKDRNDRVTLAWVGVVVSAGVISFMALLGLVFTTVLQESLQRVVGIVSPIAFAVLAVIGILLMAGVHLYQKVRLPEPKSPLLGSYVYGFFFGAIVIPCNPLFIAAFFTRVATVGEALANFANFLAFGVGIATPLLVLALVTRGSSRWLINALVRWARPIEVVAGAIMFSVSVYYLFWIFRVQEPVTGRAA